jgi:hypothetical protein
MFGKTKIPVQASLMIGTNKSLKSIKAEIILTFVAELFDDYYKLKNNSCEKLVVYYEKLAKLLMHYIPNSRFLEFFRDDGV